jgi:hypothetical protein
MGDTVRRMKLAATMLALALGAAACGDDLSLEVRVTHPEGAAIPRTVVSIYESATATCKQIEFGDLSPAQLQSILVAEQVGAGALDGISRLGKKLIVARGFDGAGRLATAGCAEHDEITGRDIVTIQTQPAATLSINALTGTELGIRVALTDVEGRSLGNHPVTWRVYGPNGATPGTSGAQLTSVPDGSWELASPTCTSDAGIARVHPVPPSRVGGYAIALRPSWPSQPNTLLTSFTRVDPTLKELSPRPNVGRPCAIRVASNVRRIVCMQLEGAAVVAREYAVTVQNGDTQLQEGPPVALDPKAVALYSVERTNGDRDVYAVTTDAQVLGLFGPSAPPAPGTHPTAGPVTDAVLLPACEPGQSAQLVLRVAPASGQRLQTMSPLGGAVTDYHGVMADPTLTLDLRGTGCVTELKPAGGNEPKRRQSTLVDITPRGPGARGSTLAVFECDLSDRTRCRVSLPVAGAGAGLSPPPRPGTTSFEEPRLTGMFFDASGVVMSSWVLLPIQNGSGEFQLVERDRVPAAAIPRFVVSGHFDGDSIADLFWDLQNANLTSNLQVTYGRTIGAQRLSALSPAEAILATDILAGDVTGDGTDDVVILGSQRRDSMTASGMFVLPMNAPLPNPDPLFDKPCE